MVSVGQERVVSVAYPMQVNPYDVKARDDNWRESQNQGIRQIRVVFRIALQQSDAQKTENHSDCHATGITHEYLFSAFDVAEHVVIKERNQHETV